MIDQITEVLIGSALPEATCAELLRMVGEYGSQRYRDGMEAMSRILEANIHTAQTKSPAEMPLIQQS